MQHQRYFLLTLLVGCATLLLVSLPVTAVSGEHNGQDTVVGTVDKDARLETTDGETFLIVGDAAEDLMIKQGEKVKVSGTIQEQGDVQTISVTSFEVLDDYTFEKEMQKKD